jgi:hypothetical protein
MGNFIADRGVGWIGFADKKHAHFYVKFSGGKVMTSLCKEHTFQTEKTEFEVKDQGMPHCIKCQNSLARDWGD